jgi:hypothetical protein
MTLTMMFQVVLPCLPRIILSLPYHDNLGAAAPLGVASKALLVAMRGCA